MNIMHTSTCTYRQDGIPGHCDCGASTLRVRLREVYGKPLVYPVNEQAKLLAELAGSKTLTSHTMTLARRMGFTVEYV